jgi:hypothetical protein
MNKLWWKLLVILAALCTASWSGVGAAAEWDADIHAYQDDQLILISGHTASDDPENVPLLITDERGQVIYFRDVAGEGTPFAFSFELPEGTAEGDAEATLYSRTPVRTSFFVEPAEKEKKKIDVSLEIVGYGGEEIFPKQTLKVTSGSSVFQLLQYASEEGEFPIEYEDGDGDGHDVYIISIDGLAEFDKGPESGWVYRVNGKGPQAPVDRYILEEGDVVEFLYTSDLGESELGENNNAPLVTYRTTDSVSVEKALRRLRFASDAETIARIVTDLLFDLGVYDLEQQRKYLPDVKAFFQAAYERAAMLAAKADQEHTTVTLSERDAEELLAEQAELLDKLHEELENSTLYKPLLADLKPVLLVALPENGETTSWQLVIPQGAWQQITDAGARIAVARGDWRSLLIPTQQRSSTPLSFSFRFYGDKEQSDQLATLQTPDGSAPVPVTGSYRITASQPAAATILADWPMTGTVDNGAWPTLYQRVEQGASWQPTSTYLTVRENRVKGKLTATGDVVVLASQPSFQDLWELPPQHQWIKEPAIALASIGVVKGTAPAQFGWKQTLSREEFVTMLARVSGAHDAKPAATRTPITRVQVAALLAESYGSSARNGSTIPFTDAALIPKEAQQAVQLVYSKGWMGGRNDGRFDPMAGLTRAEAAAILYRYWMDRAHIDEE